MALAPAPTLLGILVPAGGPAALSGLPTTAGALIIVLTSGRRNGSNPAVLNPSCTIPLTGASGVGAAYNAGTFRYRTMAHYGVATGASLDASVAVNSGWAQIAVLQWIGAASLGLAGEAGITGAGTLTPSMGGSPAASSGAVAWAEQRSNSGYAGISGWNELGESSGDVNTVVAEYAGPGSPPSSCAFAMSADGRALIVEVVEAPEPEGQPYVKRLGGNDGQARAHGFHVPRITGGII